MNCKTCESNLRSDFGYCPSCGAKVIKGRLTLKNVWEDVKFQVFDIDNTFLKTFRHLFSKPENVIESYISGARKKYMNPISYFAIAITLTGIMFFILKDMFHVNLMENSFSDKNTPNMDFIFDYQGLLSYLIMPVYALITWLLFLDKNLLNYTEHLVTLAYATGQTSFIQVAIAIPLFGFFEIRYDIFNWCYLLFATSYLFYVYKKIHKIGFGTIFIRAVGYIFMFLIVSVGMGVLMFVIGLITGSISLADFIPGKT